MFIREGNRPVRKLAVGLLVSLLAFGVFAGVAQAGSSASFVDDRPVETKSNSSSSSQEHQGSSSSSTTEETKPKNGYQPSSKEISARVCNEKDAFARYDFTLEDGTKLTSLEGNVPPGSTLRVDFKMAAECSDVPVSLVAYEAVADHYTDANVKEQKYVASDSGRFSDDGKKHSLSVQVPDCYFQVDFVTDRTYKTLTDRTYLGTLVDADTGGTSECTTPASKSPKPSSQAAPSKKQQSDRPSETVCPDEFKARVTDYEGFDYTEGNVRDANGERTKRPTSAEVSFTVADGCEETLTIASYEADSKSDKQQDIVRQTLFDSETRTFRPGNHTLKVDLPECVFQVDFVRGEVIKEFGPVGTKNFYWEQGRLLDSQFGGSECVEATTTTTTEAPAEVKGETATRPQPKLAETGFTIFPAIGLGSLLTAAGTGLLVAGKRRRDEAGYWVD